MDEIKEGSEVTTPNSNIIKIVEKIKGDQVTVSWDDKNGAPQRDTYPKALLTLKKKTPPLSSDDLKRLGDRFTR